MSIVNFNSKILTLKYGKILTVSKIRNTQLLTKYKYMKTRHT